MATLVGTQKTFIDALKELLEFEYDMKEAYKISIDKLHKENYEYKNKLSEFLEDHENHIIQLSNVLKKYNEKIPEKPDVIKNFLSKGKIYLANLIGDETILSAMAGNEADANLAYERMNARHDTFEDAKHFLKTALADEKKHKAWLDNIVNKK